MSTVLARRATALLAAACGGAPREAVLVPALFCAQVVDAIRATGASVRYYDVTPDLSPPYAALDAALGRDVGAVVWHHPFGVRHPPPDLPGVVVVEDACVALRTFAARSHDIGRDARDVVVFSPRKELRWRLGGVAAGPAAAGLPVPRLRARAATSRQWHDLDVAAAVAAGRVATRAAAAALPGLLPPATADDVRSALPLLSGARDAAVRRLRAAGVPAWYWREPLPGLTARAAPVATELWRRLFLVPTPPPGAPEYATILATGPEPWS